MAEFLDRTIDLPGGGHARASGGFYHVSFRSGSRGKGSCALAAHDYITREKCYADAERDPAIYTESGNLPDWAEGNARAFWDTADLFERVNGRLYVSADFALPVDFEDAEHVELARSFAQELTAEEHLPYTLAVHAGRDRDDQGHNPHAHLMISERQNDGIARSRQQWFRRADPTNPNRGGAPKSRTFHGREWVEHARERWAAHLNAALERKGRPERVDHRSYERQGVAREPGEHIGPSAAYQVERGEAHDRLEHAADAVDDRERLDAIERAIARLEAERGGLAHQLERLEQYPVPSDGGGGGGRGRDDESSRGR